MIDESKYMVINAGSSSLKFSLYNSNSIETESDPIVMGNVEKIKQSDSFMSIKGEGIEKDTKVHKYAKTHADAVEIMLNFLQEKKIINSYNEIKGVGHRILHGGEYFKESTLVNDEVVNKIRDLLPLGPVHHPGQIEGIEGMRKVLPNIPHVVVFDTVFHMTIPKKKYLYAIPYEMFEKHSIRKYGFHGTSYKYLTEKMQDVLSKKSVNLIICHLGNGASVAAIKDGECYNTSMGLSPLDGLIMGTRSGTADLSIIPYMCKESGISVDEAYDILNKESGLKGISGKSDMRDVKKMMLGKDGDHVFSEVETERACLAFEMFVERVIDYIAQYYFQLESKLDAIIFTAGIGENDVEVRDAIMKNVEKSSKILFDAKANQIVEARKIKSYSDLNFVAITQKDSAIPVYVIPTNEEYMILKDTYKLSLSGNM